MIIILTCIAIFLPTLLGFLIVALILKNDAETTLGERIGLSFPLGAGILTLQMFLLGILRVPLTLFNTTLPVSVELAGLAIWIWRKKVLLIPRPSSGLFAEFTSSQNNWMKKCAIIVLALWVGVKLGSVFLLTGLRPIYAWDVWAVWAAGAKAFFNSHSLMLDVPAQDFFGKNAVDRIIFYPLHNTLMQVWMSLWAGKFDEVFVKFFSPTYLLCMAICFYHFTAREINRLFALVLLAIVLSSPLMSYHSIELNSDLMLGIYLFLASLSFLKAMRGTSAYWILTGIYSSEALFIKEESFFFVMPLLLSAIIYFRSDRNRDSRKFAHITSLLIPFLAMIPWYIFRWYGLWGEMVDWALTGERTISLLGMNSALLTFHPEVIGVCFLSLVSLNNFNVIIFFFPILLTAHGKLTKESLHLLLPVACYMFFFLILYIFSAAYHAVFLMGIVFYRNLLTLYPTICLLTVLFLKKYATIQPSYSSVSQTKILK